MAKLLILKEKVTVLPLNAYLYGFDFKSNKNLPVYSEANHFVLFHIAFSWLYSRINFFGNRFLWAHFLRFKGKTTQKFENAPAPSSTISEVDMHTLQMCKINEARYTANQKPCYWWTLFTFFVSLAYAFQFSYQNKGYAKKRFLQTDEIDMSSNLSVT